MTWHLLQTAVWVGAVLVVALCAGAFWLVFNHLLDALIGDDDFKPMHFRDGYSTDRDDQL